MARSAFVARSAARRFLVARQLDGRWQREFVAIHSDGAGFSMPISERSSERLQVEGAIRFLEADTAARIVDLECGLRVSGC